MFFQAEFWVLVSFVIFIGVVWYVGGFDKMLAGIDARGERIRAELDEARRLREEATAVLADYTRRRAEAEREAEAIVASAREDAERIAREAQERLADFITRRTAAAEAKIAQAEIQASDQVRAAAADAAIRVSEQVLRSELQGPRGEELLARSLGDVRSRQLHA